MFDCGLKFSEMVMNATQLESDDDKYVLMYGFVC